MEYIINTGNYHQGKHRAIGQSADGNDGHWLSHLRAHIVAEHHGGKGQDRGQGRHKHRTQPGSARLQKGFLFAHSLIAELVGIIHQHNTIIYNNTGKHYKPDQCNDAEFAAADHQSQKSAGKGKGDGKHDDKRGEQRLELSHHNQT